MLSLTEKTKTFPTRGSLQPVADIESEQSTTAGEDCTVEERDEVHEIRKVARDDTRNVRVWRFLVTTVLTMTAISVTLTTYHFLKRQQTESFETQFEQFSRTVADAALEQQRIARVACRGFADTITAFAISTSVHWPYFEMPLFEKYSQNVIEQSKVEVLALFPVVSSHEKSDWLTFVNGTHEDLISEAHMMRYGTLDHLERSGYHPYISAATPQGFLPDIDRDAYFPNVHFAPAPRTYGFLNWNVQSDPIYAALLDDLLEMKTEILVSQVKPYSAASGIAFTLEEHAQMHKHVHLVDSQSENPHSFMYIPVYKDFSEPENTAIVAILGAPFAWDAFMIGLLPEGVDGISVILDNDCGQEYSYEVNGPTVRYLGEGDHHENKYSSMETYQDLMQGFHSHPLYDELNGHCRFRLRIYPTSKFEESLNPSTPIVFAIVVALSFALVTILFCMYDFWVHRRNEKLIANAAKSNAIVSSLFPSNIRDRIVNQERGSPSSQQRGVNNLKHFMTGNVDPDGFRNPINAEKKPLADLFLECTICFGDIAGFTAWSSVREPAQVFTLLETIYGSFDQVAKLRGAFKVETVGDCYVAATGIPDYKKDHAVLMVRFARDMLAKMSLLTKALETTLGPDTGDLSLRIGIHSGPVTAGVLRGDRARFQLFGDTMNVCSRIESTGVAGRIHVSCETAECLRRNHRSHWLVKRNETVQAKGKGELQTYWIGTGVEDDRKGSSVSSSCDGGDLRAIFEPVHRAAEEDACARMARLVDWNVTVLTALLNAVVAQRLPEASIGPPMASATERQRGRNSCSTNGNSFMPLDEVLEIIEFPGSRVPIPASQVDPETVSLPRDAQEQLRQYVLCISGMYRDNAFHCFEHASHVSMSVTKLLSRIVALPDDVHSPENMERAVGDTRHAMSYGITSDPLTHFACAFAAMIHDVDHSGVPNSQLVNEGTRLAEVFRNRSVAEQNSLVLAWDLLMTQDFEILRSTLCSSQSELERFRQLLVNAVMATDIVDRDLKELRNKRWSRAFYEEDDTEDAMTRVNRKVTIVIEHLMQASDVAHTMQHWHVYRKWNERYFRECYSAFSAGRAEQDPSERWYQNELGFFDHYIIPLAKKLKDCGVFGKSSDEYLNYAVANRNEWEVRGQEITAELTAIVQQE